MENKKPEKPDYVARHKVEEFFAGLSPKTLANRNSQGLDPTPFKRERKVFYRYKDLVHFVEGK